jgi:hypothetical protein
VLFVLKSELESIKREKDGTYGGMAELVNASTISPRNWLSNLGVDKVCFCSVCIRIEFKFLGL